LCHCTTSNPVRMLLFVVSALVASALAIPTGTHKMQLNADGTPMYPCCSPPRWMASLLDLKSPDGLKYVTQYAQDANQKVEGTLTVDRSTGNIVSQSFTDFGSMMMYSVNMYGASAGKCMKTKAPHEFYGTCNSTQTAILGFQYEGNGTLGLDALVYDAWHMQFTGGLNITMALTRDKCIPVLEQVYSFNGQKADTLLLFNDVTPNVEQGLLDMPAACAALNQGTVG